MTAKQIEAKLKRDALKATKEQRAQERKSESERKKVAKQTTKKTISLASKLSSPLATAEQKSQEVMKKAEDAGEGHHEMVENFRQSMALLEEWKKKCSGAVNYYMKNPNCELAALPFTTEKEVQNKIKEVQKEGQEIIKTLVTPAKKKNANQA